ncbi:MAG TPA: nucleoside triphosphate pyrophosphatase [Steroidobacteraceae bacterium]|jgi:septum formation protein
MGPVVTLASVSPRRQELLDQIGVPHVVVGAHIDESVQPGESPRDYVQRIARGKALAVWKEHSSLPVLAADTTVVLDGDTLGKPCDRNDALRMLARLSGRTHEVLTAVALATRAGVALRVSMSSVRFRVLSTEECVAYWETGEPRDKAGAYAIQGRAAVFVESLHGSYSGVMGLPLFETVELLQSANVPYWCRMPA